MNTIRRCTLPVITALLATLIAALVDDGATPAPAPAVSAGVWTEAKFSAAMPDEISVDARVTLTQPVLDPQANTSGRFLVVNVTYTYMGVLLSRHRVVEFLPTGSSEAVTLKSQTGDKEFAHLVAIGLADPDGTLGLAPPRIEPSAGEYWLTLVPRTTWDDVASDGDLSITATLGHG